MVASWIVTKLTALMSGLLLRTFLVSSLSLDRMRQEPNMSALTQIEIGLND